MVRLCTRQTETVRPKGSCDTRVIHGRLVVTAWKPKNKDCVQLPRLRGMLDVERQRSNALQADGLRHGAVRIHISQHVDRSEEEAAQSQARCSEVWRYLEPTQDTRDAVCHSQGWSGCIRKNIGLDLRLLVVEAWVLMLPP